MAEETPKWYRDLGRAGGAAAGLSPAVRSVLLEGTRSVAEEQVRQKQRERREAAEGQRRERQEAARGRRRGTAFARWRGAVFTAIAMLIGFYSGWVLLHIWGFSYPGEFAVITHEISTGQARLVPVVAVVTAVLIWNGHRISWLPAAATAAAAAFGVFSDQVSSYLPLIPSLAQPFATLAGFWGMWTAWIAIFGVIAAIGFTSSAVSDLMDASARSSTAVNRTHSG